MTILNDKQKKLAGTALIVLSVAPQVLFAIGTFYPPAAIAATVLQKLLSFGQDNVAGFFQGGYVGAGGTLLKKTDPDA